MLLVDGYAMPCSHGMCSGKLAEEEELELAIFSGIPWMFPLVEGLVPISSLNILSA